MSYRPQSEQEDTQLLSTICNVTVLAILQLVMIFVPLFFLVKNEEVFEFNKMIFTYAAVVIICTAWGIKTILEKKFTFRRTPFDWFIILFFLSQLISTALSIHPRTSLFGYYTRFHGGLFSTLSYLILFYSTTTFVKKKYVPGFIGVTLIGAFLTALYAFPEHFGFSPSCLFLTNKFDAACWIQDVQTRVFGTFGQPNWLAAYLILLIPLSSSLVLLSKEQDTSNSQLWNMCMKCTGFLLTFLMFATMLFTKSRSGLLGFGASWVVFIALILFQQVRTKHVQISKLFLFGAVLTLLAGTGFVFGTPFSPSLSQLHSNRNKSVEPAATTPTASVDRLEAGGTDSGDIRRIVWKGAVQVWKRYPLFGSGVETFAYSYYRDRPMEHNNVSEWDFLYNKAHNEELNFLATTGIVGLVTYILLHSVVGWFLLKEALFSKDKNTSILSASVLAGLIALHISNFFGFSTVMVTIVMYVLPALVFNQVSDDHGVHWKLLSLESATPMLTDSPSWISRKLNNIKLFKKSSHNSKVSAGQWLLVSIASMIGLFMLFQVGMIWFADHYYSQAKDALLANDFETALNKIKLAIERSPQEALYYELYSKIASQYAVLALQQNENEIGTQFANSALEASETSIKLNPVHINFYKTRNQVLVTLAQAKPELYQSAVETLQIAEQLSPTDPKLVYYSALVKNAQGKKEEAEKDLVTAITMKPNYDSARYMLGQLLETDRDYDGAKEQYQYILEKITPNNETVKKRLEAIATLSAKKK